MVSPCGFASMGGGHERGVEGRRERERWRRTEKVLGLEWGIKKRMMVIIIMKHTEIGMRESSDPHVCMCVRACFLCACVCWNVRACVAHARTLMRAHTTCTYTPILRNTCVCAHTHTHSVWGL